MNLEQLVNEVNKLKAFKAYVHQRLDDAGIPHDPFPESTKETGCRIGGRLTWLIDRSEFSG